VIERSCLQEFLIIVVDIRFVMGLTVGLQLSYGFTAGVISGETISDQPS
jgi:hypothetical protein